MTTYVRKGLDLCAIDENGNPTGEVIRCESVNQAKRRSRTLQEQGNKVVDEHKSACRPSRGGLCGSGARMESPYLHK